MAIGNAMPVARQDRERAKQGKVGMMPCCRTGDVGRQKNTINKLNCYFIITMPMPCAVAIGEFCGNLGRLGCCMCRKGERNGCCRAIERPLRHLHTTPRPPYLSSPPLPSCPFPPSATAKLKQTHPTCTRDKTCKGSQSCQPELSVFSNFLGFARCTMRCRCLIFPFPPPTGNMTKLVPANDTEQAENSPKPWAPLAIMQ